MSLIRITPFTETPHVPHGSVKTGNGALDNSWMTRSRLNSKLLPNLLNHCILRSDAVKLFIRGPIQGEAINHGLSILDAPMQGFEGWTAKGWTLRNPDRPLFSPRDMPPRYAHLQGFMSGHVPVCMASGRIILSYRFKEKAGPADTIFAGDGQTRSFTLGYPAGFGSNIEVFRLKKSDAKKKNKGKELQQGRDYQLVNVGTDAPVQIRYPLDGKPLARNKRLVVRWNLRAYRHYIFSDDDGDTWAYGNHYTDENGEPGRFGQSAIIERGPGDWVMAENTGADNIISTRFSADGVAWSAPTTIYAPTMGDDWFDQGHIIGLVFFEDPRDPGWIYLIYTGGNGFDGPGDPHYDYPEAAGLMRSRRDDMTVWEPYAHNPIHTRGSISGACAGGIWMPSVARIGDFLFSSGETVGALPVSLRPEQLDGIRDHQYGQLEDRVEIAHIPAYATRPFAFAVQFTLDRLGGDILSKSLDNETEGDFRLRSDRTGRLSIIHVHKGKKRIVRTGANALGQGKWHAALVSISRDGVSLWLDGKHVGTSKGSGDVRGNSQPIILGQGVGQRFDIIGRIDRLVLLDKAVTPKQLRKAKPGAKPVIGWWQFDVQAPGRNARSSENQALLRGNSIARDGSVEFIGPTYDNVIASQQLPGHYRGPLWSAIWDAAPFANGIYTLEPLTGAGQFIGLNSDDPEAGMALVANARRWILTWKEGHLSLSVSPSGDQRVITSLERHADAPPALRAPLAGPVTRVQQFHLISTRDGPVRLRNRDSGNMLSVLGARLGLRAYVGDDSELFHLVKV